MDLHSILSWLMNLESNTRNKFDSGVNTNIHDSVHGTVDQQNQQWYSRTEELRQKYPWLFMEDGKAYPPQEMMTRSNPNFMDRMNQFDDFNASQSRQGPYTGQELNQLIMQQINQARKERLLNPPQL